MQFTPFPLTLVGRLSEPSQAGVCETPEFLPFLRWLAGHSAWRGVATLADPRGFTKPVLPHVVADGVAATAHLLSLDTLAHMPEGALDFIQVMAEFAPEELTRLLQTVRPHLAGAGLMLAPPMEAMPEGYRAVGLPIGKGGSVLLQAVDEAPHPVMAWLCSLDDAAMREFGRFFNHLTASFSATQVRAVKVNRDTQRHIRFITTLRLKIEEGLARERHLAADMAELRRVYDVLHASTSWRLTAPVRKTVMLLRHRRRRPEIPAPAPAPAPVPVAAPEPPASGTDAFGRFVASGEVLRFGPGAAPQYSVVLVLDAEARHALACLRSVAMLPRDTFELVIVENGPTVETGQLLQHVEGARILRNSVRLSPSQALAEAFAAASAPVLLLLDPRVRLRPAPVRAALTALEQRPRIGAVTGKLVRPDRSLVEAGILLGEQGQVLAMPPGTAAETPDTQFSRAVPAGSGLFMVLRRTALGEAGGLSTTFEGRAHAVADLCLRLGELGWDTVYEPLAAVSFGDVGSAPEPAPGSAADGVFAVRHAAALARHGLPPGRVPARPVMAGQRRRLLLIDDRVPYPELGAGYPRSARIVHELHKAGWFVTVYPNVEAEDDWPTVYDAFPREVEFMLGFGRAALGHFLHERSGFYDTVIVSRPHNMRDYLDARGDTPRPAWLVYDAEALFAPREFLRLEQLGRPVPPEQRAAMLQAEMDLTESADLVTAVNETEAQVFRAAGCRKVSVLGLGVDPAPVGMGFSTRRDLLFVGALGEDRSPNADSMTWFVGEVMPLLDQRIGTGYRLLIAGRCQAPRVLGLASDRVRILGLVEDLSELYATTRIFVAPTRYAAGLPLKVHEAAGRGLPVVGTALLGRQLGWCDGQDIMLAGTADEFAAACARLYTEQELWYRIRRGGLDRLIEEARREDFLGTLRGVVSAPT